MFSSGLASDLDSALASTTDSFLPQPVRTAASNVKAISFFMGDLFGFGSGLGKLVKRSAGGGFQFRLGLEKFLQRLEVVGLRVEIGALRFEIEQQRHPALRVVLRGGIERGFEFFTQRGRVERK